MHEIERRKEFTKKNLEELKKLLSDAKEVCDGKACAYATGSYGRLEAAEDSDLDLFIVGLPTFQEEAIQDLKKIQLIKRQLNRLDEISVKADLIKATRKLGLPEFDGDGEYLKHYTGHDLVKSLGKPDDDMLNTFTARLLLLLESEPLIGRDVYDSVIEDVIAAYWRDFADHEEEFVPAFLVNDVLRLWRTFCVNYEARTQTTPDEKKILRRVKNYKLKHSRMLTCFSTILNLLAVNRLTNTTKPPDLVKIVRRTPVERLEYVRDCEDLRDSYGDVQALLTAYDSFLDRSKVGTNELVEIFADGDKHREYMAEATDFGDKIYESMISVGKDTRLLRLIMV